MKPRTRNGLLVLVLLLLVAGIVAALVHDNDDGTKRTSNEAARPPAPTAPAPTGPATSTGSAVAAPTTLDASSPRATTATTASGSMATTALARQPRTGGPATLPVGLLLVAAGLVALRFHAAAVRAMGGLQAPGSPVADGASDGAAGD
ncbi:MAG TPA: hypothetical protein VL337_12395 [Acidimicrobiales bacterium]|nr:hypothetical protein [Acidimicrobiales bacterium]